MIANKPHIHIYLLIIILLKGILWSLFVKLVGNRFYHVNSGNQDSIWPASCT